MEMSITRALLSDIEFNSPSDLVFITENEVHIQNLFQTIYERTSFNSAFSSLQACENALQNASRIDSRGYSNIRVGQYGSSNNRHDDLRQIHDLHKSLLQNMILMNQNFLQTCLISLQRHQDVVEVLESSHSNDANYDSDLFEALESVASCCDWTINNLITQTEQIISHIEQQSNFAEGILLCGSNHSDDISLIDFLQISYSNMKRFWLGLIMECRRIAEMKLENVEDMVDNFVNNPTQKCDIRRKIVYRVSHYAALGRISLDAVILETRILENRM